MIAFQYFHHRNVIMSDSLQKNKQEEEQMKVEEKSLRGVEEKKEKVW